MAGEGVPERIVRLTAELDQVPDPAARRVGEELVGAVLELHAEGLRRLLGMLADEERGRVTADPVVGGLLLIHDLHPESLEERIGDALDEVRPYMHSHGGDVELLGIDEGVARLRLVGTCDGCAASTSTLEAMVEKALQERAPDLLGMDVEGAAELPGVALPMVQVDPQALDCLDGRAVSP